MATVKDILKAEKEAFELILKDDVEIQEEFKNLQENLRPKVISLSYLLNNKTLDKKIEELKEKKKEIDAAINKLKNMKDFFGYVLNKYITTFEGSYLEIEDIAGNKYVVPQVYESHEIDEEKLDTIQSICGFAIGEYTIKLTALQYEELMDNLYSIDLENKETNYEIIEKIKEILKQNTNYSVKVSELLAYIDKLEKENNPIYETVISKLKEAIIKKPRLGVKILKNKPKNIDIDNNFIDQYFADKEEE